MRLQRLGRSEGVEKSKPKKQTHHLTREHLHNRNAIKAKCFGGIKSYSNVANRAILLNPLKIKQNV